MRNKNHSVKCSSNSRTPISKLSFDELVKRYRDLRKPCKYWNSRTRCYMEKKKIKVPLNFKISSTHLGQLIDAAVEKNILNQNSVLYLLLMNIVIGLDKQEKEFEKSIMGN